MTARAALLALLALAGCAAAQPKIWVRADGQLFDPRQFEVSQIICRGEVQKAGLASPEPDGIGFAFQQAQARNDAYAGCMAQHGYLAQR